MLSICAWARLRGRTWQLTAGWRLGDVRPAERSRPSTTVEKLGDLPPLTGLRFLAAFFILVGHGAPMMLKLTPNPQLVINVTNCFLEVGMELFFVLSGFVIHYNYAYVGRLPQPRNFAKFYIARFARIYPLYILFLALQLVVHRDFRAFLFYMGMTQSWVYVVIKGVPLIGRMGSLITWSISTEWFFYCLYPIVAWLLAKTQRRLTAALVLTALALLGLVLAVFIYLHDQEVNAFAHAAWGKRGDFFFTWLLAFSPVGRLPPFLIGIASAHIFMTRYHQPVGETERVFGLEPISKSFEEDDEAGELHEAKEVLRIKLPADKNAALPLNPGEEPFDQPAPGISAKSTTILRGALAAIGSVRRDHLDSVFA